MIDRGGQRHRRFLGTVLLVGLLLAPVDAGAASGACPNADDGVTVVVDFSAVGGGIEVGCAPGSPGSGLTALTGAGFALTEVQRSPGFVCRIGGLPADQDCVDTPPATSYWSYWHAEPGGSWQYSTAGAGAYAPPVGSVEGWAFASTNGGVAPGITPPGPAASSTTTTTKPTSTTTTTPQSTTTTATTTTMVGAATTTTTRPATTTTGPTTTTTDTATTVAATDPVSTGAGADTTLTVPTAPTTPPPIATSLPPQIEDALGESAPDHAPASNRAGTVFGVTALGSFVAAGAWFTLRRRHAG